MRTVLVQWNLQGSLTLEEVINKRLAEESVSDSQVVGIVPAVGAKEVQALHVAEGRRATSRMFNQFWILVRDGEPCCDVGYSSERGEA